MNRRRSRTAPYELVPPFGWLNAHDSLVSLALHTVTRHTQQIIEVQEDPGYPKPAATGTGGR